jgi:sec-independent protein translocase protein TatB
MLDISFSELVVCFLVALIVLGPDRLPGVARAVGRWTGRARTYMRNFSAELERETQVSELKRQLDETQRMLREQSQQVNTAVNRIADTAQHPASTSSPAPPPAHPPGEHGG